MPAQWDGNEWLSASARNVSAISVVEEHHALAWGITRTAQHPERRAQHGTPSGHGVSSKLRALIILGAKGLQFVGGALGHIVVPLRLFPVALQRTL